MPRRLKPYKVDEVYSDKTGARATLYYDRDNQDFFFELGGRVERALTVEELKRKAHELTASYVGDDWRGYIKLDVTHDEFGVEGRHQYGRHRRLGSELNISYHRFQATPVLGETNKFVIRPFPEDQASQAKRYETDRYEVERRDPDDYWLPYTERAWSTLVQINERLDQLASQLSELLAPNRAERTLTAVASNLLLLAPTQPPKKTRRSSR